LVLLTPPALNGSERVQDLELSDLLEMRVLDVLCL